MVIGNKNEVIWLPSTSFPVEIGYCPDKKAWKRFIKDIGLHKAKDVNIEWADTDGCCNQISDGKGKTYAIINFNRDADHDDIEIVGLITHEATHAYQFILKVIGETEKPSPEIEAYTMQWLVQGLYQAWRTKKQD